MNEIARRLIYDRYYRAWCLNNYTPRHWYECDVFELTTANVFVEYEIKASRADFFADRKKGGDFTYNNETGRFDRRNDTKHARLANADPAGPSRFWFVLPHGLIQREELPSFAGLIEFARNGRYDFPYCWTLNTVVEAPKLHQSKWQGDRLKFFKTFYWRYHKKPYEVRDNTFQVQELPVPAVS